MPAQRKDWEATGVPLPRPLPSMYEAVSSDEDAVLRTIMAITAGITTIVDKVQK
jgi:dynein heavy chain, axonemal